MKTFLKFIIALAIIIFVVSVGVFLFDQKAPESTGPDVTEPQVTEPQGSEPEETEPEKLLTVYKGNYSDSTVYVVGDVVLYDYGVYLCINENTGYIPSDNLETYWEELSIDSDNQSDSRKSVDSFLTVLPAGSYTFNFPFNSEWLALPGRYDITERVDCNFGAEKGKYLRIYGYGSDTVISGGSPETSFEILNSDHTVLISFIPGNNYLEGDILIENDVQVSLQFYIAFIGIVDVSSS